MIIMAKNSNLHTAKKAKNDEFYTQYEDIEKELIHYTDHFTNKTVYCNCDNPEWSNFWLYFYNNFHKLKLKKLISTHWTESVPNKPSVPVCSLHSQSYKLEYDGKTETKTYLQGNGDFQSPECLQILEECDIVCSNPPFSKFRVYVSTLVEYNKQFLIIGNINAVAYKEIFPLIKDNKMWFGPSIHSGDREFRVPNNYPLNATGFRVDNDGNKYIRVKGVRWFTNLDHKQRHEPLELAKKYSPEEYPKYDNYDAINVNKTKDIPYDYCEYIGVPITFLDKYNPEQFEILDCHEPAISLETLKESPNFKEYKSRQVTINGVACQKTYHRIFIKRKGGNF